MLHNPLFFVLIIAIFSIAFLLLMGKGAIRLITHFKFFFRDEHAK